MTPTCANCKNWKQHITDTDRGNCPHFDKMRDTLVRTWTYSCEYCEKWEGEE